MQIFETNNLTYFYPDSNLPALEDINLKISQGEMILLVGHSGCGKSTLLKFLAGLVPGFYGGRIAGNAFFNDTNILKELKPLAPKVGILFQDPEKQLITSTVEREIALPMENVGTNHQEAKRRLSEVVCAVGIEELAGKKIRTLSSGQKQKVALASILGMNPDVLLLDEPTSQIDPISSEELLNMVRKIAEDSGKTIIMAEQKFERCLHFADRVIAMDNGRIVFDGCTDEYCRWACKMEFEFVPIIPRLFSGLNIEEIPITIKEGRKVLSSMLKGKTQFQSFFKKTFKREIESKVVPKIKIKNLKFPYDDSNCVLKNINIEIKQGEFVAILGQNGTGKTTLLKNINGLLRPESGTIEISGVPTKGKSIYELAHSIAYLGQNPDDYLFSNTVKDEVLFTLNNFNRKWDKKTGELLSVLRLDKVQDKNPRDLSSGQKQRTALASIMCMLQEIILLDEPTRGMDYTNKQALGEMLLDLQNIGTTIVLVTHDVDFAAEYCDRVIIMHDGEIIGDGTKEEVLKSNLYYSSQISKLFNGFGDFVTFKEAEEALKELTAYSDQLGAR